MNDYTTDITYFSRLLEFTVGILAILLLAEAALLAVYIYKNNRKKRHIRILEQKLDSVNSDRRPEGSGLYPPAKKTPGEGSPITERKEGWELEKQFLESELADIQTKMVREQYTRKRMEDEIARLLDLIKNITPRA